jgi:hypothetical protein
MSARARPAPAATCSSTCARAMSAGVYAPSRRTGPIMAIALSCSTRKARSRSSASRSRGRHRTSSVRRRPLRGGRCVRVATACIDDFTLLENHRSARAGHDREWACGRARGDRSPHAQPGTPGTSNAACSASQPQGWPPADSPHPELPSSGNSCDLGRSITTETTSSPSRQNRRNRRGLPQTPPIAKSRQIRSRQLCGETPRSAEPRQGRLEVRRGCGDPLQLTTDRSIPPRSEAVAVARIHGGSRAARLTGAADGPSPCSRNDHLELRC